MEVRPLAERVAGVDDAVLTAAGDRVDGRALAEVRVVCASFVRRHGEVLSRLADGDSPEWLVADGVCGPWPDDAEIDGGLPRHGVEMHPVAVAAAADATDVDAFTAGAHAVLAELRDTDPDTDLAGAVAAELLEAVLFAIVVGA